MMFSQHLQLVIYFFNTLGTSTLQLDKDGKNTNANIIQYKNVIILPLRLMTFYNTYFSKTIQRTIRIVISVQAQVTGINRWCRGREVSPPHSCSCVGCRGGSTGRHIVHRTGRHRSGAGRTHARTARLSCLVPPPRRRVWGSSGRLMLPRWSTGGPGILVLLVFRWNKDVRMRRVDLENTSIPLLKSHSCKLVFDQIMETWTRGFRYY